MNKVTLVKSCRGDCPFFGRNINGVGSGAVMICNHPAFEGKGFAGAIITQENSNGRVPYDCPLRYDDIATIVTLNTEL